MSIISDAPEVGAMEIASDVWTDPFWAAAGREVLLAPRCCNCGKFRWPPGPFCPHCRTQEVEWVPPGAAKLFSYTIITSGSVEKPPFRNIVPALISFPEAENVRITAAIVDTPLDQLRIDADLSVAWLQAVNTKIPVFRVLQSKGSQA